MKKKWYHAKVLLKRFHLNGYTIGLEKLELHSFNNVSGSAQLNSETVNLCQTLRVLVFYSDQNEMCYFVFCWYFTCITCSMSHLSFFLQYMFFFQLPYLPEYVVEMQDFKTLENMFKVLILVMHLRILNLREAGKVGKAFDLFCLPHP